MDLTCTRCGEPIDNDTIHDEVAERNRLGILDKIGAHFTYATVADEFRTYGCQYALVTFMGRDFTSRDTVTTTINPDGTSTTRRTRNQCEKVTNARTVMASALADLMGDDMDGYAAMLDDAEFLGYF